MFRLLSQRLYLRIWLAAVLSVAVLTLLVAWAWRVAAEHNRPAVHEIVRQVVITDEHGKVLAESQSQLRRGGAALFEVELPNQQRLQIELSPPMPSPDRMGPPDGVHRPMRGPPGAGNSSRWFLWWVQPPWGFVWMLLVVALAVALAVYPIARRLTQRLETLQKGVQQWGEGDLTVRVPQQGRDEVADLARRFNAAAERVQHLMTSQKSLLANASHELRSPLARIRMGVELMQADDDANRNAGIRQELKRSIGELDGLIEEILLASRLDAKQADMGLVETVDLMGLCAEECARLGASFGLQQGLQKVEVQGVSKLLRRLVRNLLENAQRYGRKSSNAQTASQASPPYRDDLLLLLRVDEASQGAAGPQVVIGVFDRGPGVPAHLRERIFEPFFRLPGASEKQGGVGLGLALVKSIAQRHGGQVHCEDREGGGSSFVVTLPQ